MRDLITMTDLAALLEISERTAERKLRTDPHFPEPVYGAAEKRTWRRFHITDARAYKRLRDEQRAA